MAYVYKHTRLDNNEIFYIGIGSDDFGKYSRAHSLDNRNKFWQNVVKKTKYKVDILFDNLTWGKACEKEKELIKIIGKKILNEGTLVNLTDGGEGFKKNHTIETKEKISNNLSDRTYESIHGKNSKIEKKKRSEGVKKSWKNLDEIAKKERSKNISVGAKGVSKSFKNVKCSKCSIEGSSNIMHKWHFENCKFNNDTIDYLKKMNINNTNKLEKHIKELRFEYRLKTKMLYKDVIKIDLNKLIQLS